MHSYQFLKSFKYINNSEINEYRLKKKLVNNLKSKLKLLNSAKLFYKKINISKKKVLPNI